MTCVRVPVPKTVWLPIAERIADEHGVTVHQLRFEVGGQQFYVPRFKFWKALRALPDQYSLAAIGDVTGSDHTSVLSGLRSRTGLKDYGALMARINRRKRPRTLRDLSGERFGMLTVESAACRPPNRSLKPGRWWKCMCDCGCEVFTVTAKLTTGRKSHCGNHQAKVHRVTADGAAAVRALSAAVISHPLSDAA
jgi:hypothetical protein